MRDEGVGIAPAHLARLCDPFFTTKHESGGTGLGLAITASLVRGHGGQLTFASEPGKGTRARVTFLCPEAEPPSPANIAICSRGDINAMTHVSALPVLLVDDDPQVLHSASIVLRTSGITPVITADDSRAVMPLLAEQDVGVLVLDLTMPYLSGHTLLEQVAGDYPDIPIILLTATNDLETAVQCMQTGAFDYLVKPVGREPAGLVCEARPGASSCCRQRSCP